MTTCLTVMKTAYRRSGVLGVGVELTSAQRDVGMDCLQGMFTSMVNGGMFGRLTDYNAEDDYEAKEGDRVLANGFVITLPDTVIDDITGLERPPVDGSVIVIVENDTDPFTHEVHIYSANRGWVIANGLGYADVCPLSDSFEEEIKNLLAEQLAGENGIPLTNVLMKNVAKAKLAIASKYSVPRKAARHTFY